MKKIFALCATIALLSGLVIVTSTNVAHAQASGPFADVPTDHWAYTAVDTLQKAGIVIGYPDGTYGGKRAMTRYEFATAIARLLPLIKPPDLSGYATNDQLTALQNDLTSKLEQNQAALDALKALVDEFQPELQQLGQDVDAIKTRLTALEERVAVVEAEQRRVKINADVNVIARSNIETSGTGLVDKNGYFLQNQTPGSPKQDNIWAAPNVYNDVLLSITGQVSDTATAVIKIDATNYLDAIRSGESLYPDRGFNDGPADTTLTGNSGLGSESFDIFRAYLDAPVSLGAVGGAEAKVGRFGQQFTPYTLKAINPDSYASLPETDTGDVSVDGGNIAFNAGPVAIQAFAGKNSPISNEVLQAGLDSAEGTRSGQFLPGSRSIANGGLGEGGVITPLTYIDQSAGARATFGTPDTYTIGVTALMARVNAVDLNTGAVTNPTDPVNGKAYNNMLVYGADYNGYIPGLQSTGVTLNGEVAVASTGRDTNFANVDTTHGNIAWNAQLGYTAGPLTVKGGYQDVYPDYAAPGSWGQIGSWINPTNIQGGLASASYTLSPTMKIVADGNLYQGQFNVGANSPLGKGDDLDSFDIGLKSALTSAYSVDLGYEYVYWDLKNKQGLLYQAGKPTEQYITIGIGHPLNKNANVRLAYQIISYTADHTDFEGENLGNALGGVATTQFEFKF
jgi:hypothetical protein